MKLRSIYKSVIIPAAISSALLIGAPNLHAKQSLDSQETHILKFDYKKGEINNYSVDVTLNGKFTGYIQGNFSGKGNALFKEEVIEEYEECYDLEARIQQIRVNTKQKISGLDFSINLDWNAGDKNIWSQAFDNAILEYEIGKGGEVDMDNLDFSLSFFPDHAVKIGDSWTSSFMGYDEDNIKLEIIEKTRYQGVDALVINFSGKKEDEEDFTKTGIKGNLTYDPANKRLLKVDSEINKKMPFFIDKRNPETKSEVEMNLKLLIKRK